MNDLQVFIYNALSSIANTFYGDMERDSEGRIVMNDVTIVYALPNAECVDDYRKDIRLELNVWGYKRDTSKINNTIEEIESYFKRNKVAFFNGKNAMFFIQDIKEIPDDFKEVENKDKQVKRTQINYTIKFIK